VIQSIDPTNNTVVKTFPYHDGEEVETILQSVWSAQRSWSAINIDQRAGPVHQLGSLLRERRTELARLATLEMGKPVVQAETEIDKCAETCDFFADEAAGFLAPESIATRFDDAYVLFEPLGVVLAIMPWNFPFWQVFRQIAPALMAGDGVLLRHASNVPMCSMAIEEIIKDSGLPDGIQRSIMVPTESVETLIADRRIAAVSVTGSSEVGGTVAAQAARHLKRQVLELGGSDPFLVLDDADVIVAAAEAARARNFNAGQSCVAAKRFIVSAAVVEEFSDRLVASVANLKVGDPTDRATEVGPLARPDLVATLHRQVKDSVAAGARLAIGGVPMEGAGNFFAPTVLTDVTPGMAAFDEETFGPVAAVVSASDDSALIDLANHSPYGLGASIWTKDADRAAALARGVEAGAVFVNSRVSSDPRLPFGGTKRSGYGRELGSFGIRELTNIKAVAVTK
jgi:succinate-semialdehyde dehydrogenase/glutarate-semialdehyde dehydrogenase